MTQQCSIADCAAAHATARASLRTAAAHSSAEAQTYVITASMRMCHVQRGSGTSAAEPRACSEAVSDLATPARAASSVTLSAR